MGDLEAQGMTQPNPKADNQSPAEALRQQIRKACMVNIGREVEAKVCSISQKQTDAIMELVTAYAATVEREARIETAKYLKKYMISTSPFIEEIVDPYIEKLEDALKRK